jgi:hypothetical protein
MLLKTIGIVITDGVGFRNFILSDFPQAIPKKFDKAVIYSCLPISAYPAHITGQFTIVQLAIYREGTLTGFLRKVKELAHLRNHATGNFGIADNLKVNWNPHLTKKGILTRIAFLLSNLFHSETNILWWTRMQMHSIRKHPITENYTSLLKQHNPDILFFTHQRPPFVAPMIEAAQQSKIKTVAFIFSWDNLASKGRMAGNFDAYIVWSKLMKDELLHFYPSVKAEQIHVGGTPQFEPYVMDVYRTERSEFYKRFDIDATKPTICFSCGDISTSKNDELYITEIANAIRYKQLNKEVNFIVRTSPAESPERFFEIGKQFPFINWNYPKWNYAREGHPEPWTQRIPTPEDVKDLRALLEYCDVNINMCSTMSLDFMQFDKPVINPVFGNEDNGLYDDQRFLKYAHYERVAQSGAVAIVKNSEEMIASINGALQHPEKASAERKKLLDIQIGRPLKGTSEAIAGVLYEMCSLRSSTTERLVKRGSYRVYPPIVES